MTVENVINKINSADEVTLPEPDISILRQGRRKPSIFPLEILGEAISSWALDAAHGAGAPIDYVIGALLSASTALIGNSRRLSPWEGWEEASVNWIALVGDPSSGKSPGIDPVFKLLRTIESEMAAGFEEKLKEYETKKAAANYVHENWQTAVKLAVKNNSDVPQRPDEAVEPQEVMRPRILGNDSSTEKVALLLSTYLKGLLFYRDELQGWLGGFGKYNGGKDADRAFWLEAYGGRPFIIDRVKHKSPIRIPYLLVSVMGGIQPDRLNALIQGSDDGLAARFLWIWPDNIPPVRPSKKVDNTHILNALRKLNSLSLDKGENDDFIPRIMPLTEEAANLLQEWREEHHKCSQNVSGFLASSYGKSPGHLLHLAITLEHLWWAISEEAKEPASIGEKAIAGAAHLVDCYFKPMAEHVFNDVSIPEEERLACTLANYIVKTKPEIINLRSIRRDARLSGLRNPEKVLMAANSLIEAGWLLTQPEPAGKGRPRSDFKVNSRLWELLK